MELRLWGSGSRSCSPAPAQVVRAGAALEERTTNDACRATLLGRAAQNTPAADLKVAIIARYPGGAGAIPPLLPSTG